MKKGSKVRRIAKSCNGCTTLELLLGIHTPEINDEATVQLFLDNGSKMTLEEYGNCSMFPGGKFPYHPRDFEEVEPPFEEVVTEIKKEVELV